jgi:hypothetical protein
MAFVTLNGYDVEHASSLLVYENLFPEIQHINGKGVTDKYTQTDDVESVTLIDVMRVLPYAPRFRQLGSKNNGAWHNKKNQGGVNNASQSVHYTIPVDLIYDEGVPITHTQDYSNPINLKRIVMAQLVKTAGLAINVVTYAKQIEAFFRDSFKDPEAPTASELAAAVFAYDTTKKADEDGSAPDAFIAANSSLTDGCVEIGAMHIPMEERQAFVTSDFDRVMKRQYAQNASDVSAKILATGFINPFNNQEGKRINSATGIVGMYDGVDMFLFNATTRKFVEVALGLVKGTNDDVITLIEKMGAMIVYGAGTIRGIVGPNVEANKHPFQKGVYIIPMLKMGVEVVNGKTIKMVVKGGWSAEDVASIASVIKFTPIDGETVTGNEAFDDGVFNDGTNN